MSTATVPAGRWISRELALGLVVFACYLAVTHVLQPDVLHVPDRVPQGHGQALLTAERHLHVAIEHAADRALAPHRILGLLAAYEYATTYIAVTLVTLVWLAVRRPGAYPRARTVLLVTTLVAIACFLLDPTAPPRLLHHSGYATPFVDVVAVHHPPGSWGGGPVTSGANQLAAMPSLHIGWSAWASAALARARAPRWARTAAFLHTLLTAVVIVTTGNHYVLDIVAGWALVEIGAVALRWHREPARS